MPTTNELAWAAGFLEGEGFFGNESRGYGFRVAARQNEPYPLEKLQRLFGGPICSVSTVSNKFSRQSVIFDWTVSGERARGVAFTLYTLLSPRRRKQVREALARTGKWRSAKPGRA